MKCPHCKGPVYGRYKDDNGVARVDPCGHAYRPGDRGSNKE